MWEARLKVPSFPPLLLLLLLKHAHNSFLLLFFITLPFFFFLSPIHVAFKNSSSSLGVKIRRVKILRSGRTLG